MVSTSLNRTWRLLTVNLAIIDTSDMTNQPFLLEGPLCDGYSMVKSIITANYVLNFQSLGSHFHLFLIQRFLLLLMRSGARVSKSFNGMWAFIVWDRQEKVLFCSRDRFGIKPLYWAQPDVAFSCF